MFASLILAAMFATPATLSDAGWSTDPKGAVTNKLGYYPVPLTLSAVKPDAIKKEPKYAATPKYGTFKLGDGPKSTYYFVLDEPNGGPFKMYIDKNQDGDLTENGDGSWNKKTDGDRPMYGVMSVDLRASYGSSTTETSSEPYTLGFYRFVRPDPNPLYCFRQTSKDGDVVIDGKSHKALLVENDADGLYNKPVATAEDVKAHRPVWLLLDLKDDGKYSHFDIRAPFSVDGKVYAASVSDDGTKVTVNPTDKPVPDFMIPKERAPKPTLASGTPAPDFVASKWGGGDLKLSDYLGHVVVLDFWATWCGPCQRSMPHIQSVYDSVKSQGVVVLGVCVWDDEQAYDKWVPEHQTKYNFQLAFDKAGKDTANSIAAKLFNVDGIPTTYIIGKDGKVVSAVVGYDSNDKRVEEALKLAGVTVP